MERKSALHETQAAEQPNSWTSDSHEEELIVWEQTVIFQHKPGFIHCNRAEQNT